MAESTEAESTRAEVALWLVDSDILIDVSRGRESARRFLVSLGISWCVSQVNAMELIAGARDQREVHAIDGFLSGCRILPLRAAVGSTAYELLKKYSRSHGLQVFDSLVAATAIEAGLTLVSRNRKHFTMIETLRFESPEY